MSKESKVRRGDLCGPQAMRMRGSEDPRMFCCGTGDETGGVDLLGVRERSREGRNELQAVYLVFLHMWSVSRRCLLEFGVGLQLIVFCKV